MNKACRLAVGLIVASQTGPAPAQSYPARPVRLEKQALEPRTSTPEEFAAFRRAEYDKWGKVIGALKRQETFSR